MNDTISRQQAIDTAVTVARRTLLDSKPIDVKMSSDYIFVNLVEPMRKLPTVEPEPAIPLQWIEGQIEWLKSLDNAFSTLTAGQISAMVNTWKDEQYECINPNTRCR